MPSQPGLIGEILEPGTLTKREAGRSGHIYIRDPKILGEFRVRVDDPDFGVLFYPKAFLDRTVDGNQIKKPSFTSWLKAAQVSHSR